MKYEEMFKNIFSKLMEEYKLKLYVASNREIILIGRSFALVFYIRFQNVEIYYINRNASNKFEEYNVNNFLLSKFDEIDRKGINLFFENVEQEIKEQFIICSRGLKNHWSNLLTGDQKWMIEYLLEDPARKPFKVDEDLEKVLERYF